MKRLPRPPRIPRLRRIRRPTVTPVPDWLLWLALVAWSLIMALGFYKTM